MNTPENAINCFHIGSYLVSLHAPFVTLNRTFLCFFFSVHFLLILVQISARPIPCLVAKNAHNLYCICIQYSEIQLANRNKNWKQRTIVIIAQNLNNLQRNNMQATYGYTYRFEIPFGVRQ